MAGNFTPVGEREREGAWFGLCIIKTCPGTCTCGKEAVTEMSENQPLEEQDRPGPAPPAAEQTVEEPDLQPPPEDEPVETRGLGWVIVPVVLGTLLGALVGLVQATNPDPVQGKVANVTGELLLAGAVTGGIIGLFAGAGLGLFIWVFFPYKGRNPHAFDPEEEHREAEAPPEETDQDATERPARKEDPV